MSEIGRVIDEVVRGGLAIALKAAGYRKDGRTFRHADEHCTRVVNVQTSQWNAGDQGNFTLNLGLHFPAVVPYLDWTRDTGRPTETDCLVRERIGHLMPAEQDHWWTITSETDTAALANEIRETWERYGAPWMDAYADLPAARRFTVRKKLPLWAAAVSLALSEPDAARSHLAEAIAGWPANSDGATRLLEWGRRHRIAPDAPV